MLKKFSAFKGHPGPVVLVVMDGVAHNENDAGNAVKYARTPNLDRLWNDYPHLLLKAHGTAVGMPDDSDMGNSEVGHNAIGAGQIYQQGASLVSDSIEDGTIWKRDAWQEIVSNAKSNSGTLHFIGLFSDGNVHSHINHLKAMVQKAKQEGLKKVRIHALLDGRDVPETSALEYLEPFEAFLKELNDSDFDARVASGGGRQYVTMDRYDANWSIVERGWHAHVLGKGPAFQSAKQAIEAHRQANPGVIDQDLPPFVIEENGKPVGTIEDGDSVVFFNFRGDRAIEMTKAFENEQFDKFDRVRHPKVCYAGMLQYDGDLQIPKRFLVPPPSIRNTMAQHLCENGISQFAISETQKFGHVTYFWNGNRSGKFDPKLETYQEITSDLVPFEQRPWMKAAEITDAVIDELKKGSFKFARLNYPNGDMVGHTGSFRAATMAVETVDLCLGRLMKVLDEVGGMGIFTADHGNSDEMYEMDKKTGQPQKSASGNFKAKTSHSLHPVPCFFYDNVSGKAYKVKQGKFGLANLAATSANLLGFEAAEMWEESVLTF